MDNVVAYVFLIIIQNVCCQICVLPGTCVPRNTIDIRIVTPTAPPTMMPTTSPGTCPPGLELCFGTISPQCGVQYVQNISQQDGNATPGAHPWQAFIVNQTSYTGSGLLLDSLHVLTAAHKVASNVQTPSNIGLYFGVYSPNSFDGVVNRTAVRIVTHPNFNPTTLFNDVAIVRLNEPVPLGTNPMINIGCLPDQGTDFTGQRCIVAGWGQTEFNLNNSPVIPQKQVTVPIVPDAICRASFSSPNLLGNNVNKYLDTNGELCAGGEANRDACTNDGGAPLMCTNSMGRKVVAGLVIWGKGCGTAGVYGVYVNVARYTTWINLTVKTLSARLI